MMAGWLLAACSLQLAYQRGFGITAWCGTPPDGYAHAHGLSYPISCGDGTMCMMVLGAETL